ncbi:MAG: hypothetical protein O3B38_05825 [Chloroflexi bacterium]|nr:hypothetical protein [Chloroflexota bacterium]
MTKRDRRKRSLSATDSAVFSGGSASSAAKREDIAADYTHIRADLKRIGILFVVLISGMVALSRFIH